MHAASDPGREAPASSGLVCPRCEYDLTGLVQPRCPECGSEFEWSSVERWSSRRPRLAFERARGLGRIRGFIATWLCVLVLPLRFARQARQRVSLPAGLIFGAVCFALTGFALFFGADGRTYLMWFGGFCTAILLESILLTVIDLAHLRNPIQSFVFWIAVGGYTSAIVPTEIVYGPPYFVVESLDAALNLDTSKMMLSEPSIHWVQVASWVVSLACVLAIRLRRKQIGPLVIATLLLLQMLGMVVVLVLASGVGWTIYEWTGGFNAF